MNPLCWNSECSVTQNLINAAAFQSFYNSLQLHSGTAHWATVTMHQSLKLAFFKLRHTGIYSTSVAEMENHLRNRFQYFSNKLHLVNKQHWNSYIIVRFMNTQHRNSYIIICFMNKQHRNSYIIIPHSSTFYIYLTRCCKLHSLLKIQIKTVTEMGSTAADELEPTTEMCGPLNNKCNLGKIAGVFTGT